MWIKNKKLVCLILLSLLFFLIVPGLSDMKSQAADNDDTLVTAQFAVLNRGYERPTTTKSESQSKYTKTGKGKIYEAISIENDDAKVKANIAVEPDISLYLDLGENETVVWYVIKKENDGWHVDGEIVTIEEEQTTEKITEEATTEEVTTEAETEVVTEPESEPVTAIFALLNRGYSRPSVTKSESSAKYTKAGKGKIRVAEKIDNNDRLVEANIYQAPDLSAYLNENETVIWYVVKKESDGWHVDGEIVTVDDSTVSENEELCDLLYEVITNGDSSYIDISSYSVNYAELKYLFEYTIDNEAYVAEFLYNEIDFEVSQQSNVIDSVKLTSVPENFEKDYDSLCREINDVLYGMESMEDDEIREFIKDYLENK